ncbi:MAG TPA: S-layer homology domain-containing protein [Candidatus Aquicultor sp.]
MERKERRLLSLSLAMVLVAGMLFLGAIIAFGSPASGAGGKAAAAITGPARLPKVVQGFTGQLAGNLRVSESTGPSGTTGSFNNQDLWLRIASTATSTARGVTFSSVPEVTRSSGNATVGMPTLVNGMVRIPITEAATATRAATTISITNIRYDVVASAPEGTVMVEVLASDGTPTSATPIFGSAANARVVTGETITFPDIVAGQPGFFAVAAISFLELRGVINGYPDGRFRPQNNVTRAEFAKMAVITRGITLVPAGAASFGDVPANYWAARYIATARAAGLIKGYPDGRFRPNNNITRAEIAAIIVRASGVATNTNGTTFSDVPSSFWAFNEIMTARNDGFLSGYTDNTFRPNNLATRAEAAQFNFNWAQ